MKPCFVFVYPPVSNSTPGFKGSHLELEPGRQIRERTMYSQKYKKQKTLVTGAHVGESSRTVGGFSCSQQWDPSFDTVHCISTNISTFPGGPDSLGKYTGKRCVPPGLKQS